MQRNQLLNFAIMSSKLSSGIILQNPKGDFELRPTIQLMYIAAFGNLKTTLAKIIGKRCKSKGWKYKYLNDYTYASLAGSVEKKGQIMYPSSIDCINGTMIIDEFIADPMEKSLILKSLNSLVEDETTHRGISRHIAPKSLKLAKKLYPKHFKQTASGFEWNYIRSNWIFLTAYDPLMSNNQQIQMLASRCVPIYFTPSLEDINNLIDNPDLFFKPLDLQMPKQRPVSREEFLAIRSDVYQIFKERDLTTHGYLRTVDDIVRCFVLNNYKRDYELEKYVIGKRVTFARRAIAYDIKVVEEIVNNDVYLPTEEVKA